MRKIEVNCCEGNARYKDECLKERCPLYNDAKVTVDRSWPYVGTGFGNLYGNPSDRTYLSAVRNISQEDRHIESERAVAMEKSSIKVDRIYKESGIQIVELRVNPLYNDWQRTSIGPLRVSPVISEQKNNGKVSRSIKLYYQEGSELRPRSNGINSLKSRNYREIDLVEENEGWQYLRRDVYDQYGDEIPTYLTEPKILHLIVDNDLEPELTKVPEEAPTWRSRPRLLTDGQILVYNAILEDTGMMYSLPGVEEAHDRLIDRLNTHNRRLEDIY